MMARDTAFEKPAEGTTDETDSPRKVDPEECFGILE